MVKAAAKSLRVQIIGGPATEVRYHRLPGETAASQRASLNEFLRWNEVEVPDRQLDYYFNSYSHMGIHEEMLKDRVRTLSYYNAIVNNAHVFRDKVVLDVGAGTGVLSMFAARAGASHVYGIEYSDVALLARDLVRHNKLEDKVTIIQAKAEETELPVDKVDIIISEWMGYFLLYESMLDCVIHCRDKWLKSGGIILPNKATMFIAGLEDGEYKDEKFSFWNDVYGLDYSIVRKALIEEPLIDTVSREAVITDACCIADFDLATVTVADLDFVSRFKITAERQEFLHGFVGWFDCTFSAGLHKPIVFSTSPLAQYTHWKQSVFYTNQAIPIKEGESIEGVIAVRKGSPNPRTIDVRIKYEFKGDVTSTEEDIIYHIR